MCRIVFLCRFEVEEGEEGYVEAKGRYSMFQVETGRWQGVKREDRVCKEFDSGELEDVTHLRCSVWSSHCQPLLAFVQSPTEDEEGTAHLLSCAYMLALASNKLQHSVYYYVNVVYARFGNCKQQLGICVIISSP